MGMIVINEGSLDVSKILFLKTIEQHDHLIVFYIPIAVKIFYLPEVKWYLITVLL